MGLGPGEGGPAEGGAAGLQDRCCVLRFPARCSATSRLGFRLLIRCLAGDAAQEFLKDRPVSEAVNVQGSTNYKKYSMYKDDKTTHSRTQHGPSDMTVLPKTQGQARSPLAAAPRGPPPPPAPRRLTRGVARRSTASSRSSRSASCLLTGELSQGALSQLPAGGLTLRSVRRSGPYYPRNPSQETKIADALARDFAKG